MGLCGFNRMRRETKVVEQTDEEIRQQAKDLGIKSWHVKNIDKLKKEIEEVNNG